MQLEMQTRVIEKSQEFEQEQYFQLGDLSLVMSILRSKLYSDPIKAICQEIASNSRDAHREVGHPEVPIEILLPTELSPRISFKDYGPGISPERMTDIYLKYGGSSKRSDNNQTGGFGLGAKTPFAYGDSFVIDTIHRDEISGQHVRSQYCAYLDESNLGKVTLLTREHTDLPTGTEIQISVNQKDFDSFTRHVWETTKYWDVLPVLYPVERQLEHLNLEFKDRVAFLQNSSSLIVLIDRIPYKFDWWDDKKLAELGYDSEQIKLLHFYLKSNQIILEFQTGELSISANRERVEINDKNLKAIFDTFLTYDQNNVLPFSKSIPQIKTLLDISSFFNEFSKNFPDFMRGRVQFEDFKWNGIKVSNRIQLSNSYDRIYSLHSFKFSCYKNEAFLMKKILKYLRMSGWSQGSISIEDPGTDFVIIDDCRSNVEQRLKVIFAQRAKELHEKRALEENQNPGVSYPPSVEQNGYFIRSKTSKLRGEFIKSFKDLDKIEPFLKTVLTDPLFKVYRLSEVKLPNESRVNSGGSNRTRISDLDLFSRDVSILYQNLTSDELSALKLGNLPEDSYRLLGVYIGQEGGFYKDPSFKENWRLNFNTCAKRIPTDEIVSKLNTMLDSAKLKGVLGKDEKIVVLRMNSKGVKSVQKANLDIQPVYAYLSLKVKEKIDSMISGAKDPEAMKLCLALSFSKSDGILSNLKDSTKDLIQYVFSGKYELPQSFSLFNPYLGKVSDSEVTLVESLEGFRNTYRLRIDFQYHMSDTFKQNLLRCNVIMGMAYDSFYNVHDFTRFLNIISQMENYIKSNSGMKGAVHPNY